MLALVGWLVSFTDGGGSEMVRGSFGGYIYFIVRGKLIFYIDWQSTFASVVIC